MDLFYVSPAGNDRWSGRLPEPNLAGTDGPVATLGRARDIVRSERIARGRALPLRVLLRGGTYRITEGVLFGPEDSGPVTYAAFPGETPVLDGGFSIGGWSEQRSDSSRVWVAEIPEVIRKGVRFSQLFVNGHRRSRPRLPKEGFFRIRDVPSWAIEDAGKSAFAFECASGDIPAMQNLERAEAVLLHYWIEERLPVLSFEPDRNIVICSGMARFGMKDDDKSHFARYYLENVGEAFASPGEWYLDEESGIITYHPFPDECIEDAEIIAPTALRLLRLEGEPEEHRFVEQIRFSGIRFLHTDSIARYPVPNAGRRGYSSSGQAACEVPGAIYLRGARSCSIENCVVEHLGGYAVELGDGCRWIAVTGCTIVDTGAGGVKLNGSDASGSIEARTGNNIVTDCEILRGGRIFHSAVGILSMHSFGNTFSHNRIADYYYTGISCGWVWGYGESVSRDNRIEKNHIHDLGQGFLSDLGGIYTLGVQPGTIIRGNVIHDVDRYFYGGWGIYLDEGSSHILVENNICYRTRNEGLHQH